MADISRSASGLSAARQGWKVERLGDLIRESKQKNKAQRLLPVFTVSNTKGFVLSDNFFDKQVYSRDLTGYKIVEPGSFAYNPYRINVGSIGLHSGEREGLVSPAYVVFGVRDRNQLLPEYLLYLLKSEEYRSEIQRYAMSRGSVRRSLSLKDLAKFEVLLPPILEQHAIVHALYSVQRAQDATEQVIASTRELKKSILKHLFTYGPVPMNQVNQTPLKETEIGALRADWEVLPLGKIADLSTGTTPATKRTDYYNGHVPFIKTGEIAQNVITIAATHVSEEAIKDYNLKRYKPGTVFLAMYGQGKTRGQVALLSIEAATTQNTAAIESHDEIDSRFLWFNLMSRYHELRGEGAHGQISHLNLGYARQFLIPVPPLEEQHRIVQIASAVVQKLDAEMRRKASLDEVFRSLRKQLLVGDVGPHPQAEGESEAAD